jgi:hypothetical protein
MTEMALLDLQTLEVPEADGLNHGKSAASKACFSGLSLLLCG